jgi:TPR repeat protein
MGNTQSQADGIAQMLQKGITYEAIAHLMDSSRRGTAKRGPQRKVKLLSGSQSGTNRGFSRWLFSQTESTPSIEAHRKPKNWKMAWIPIDLQTAMYYLKLAADQGIAAAQYNHRICLHSGDGIPFDLKGAAHSLKLAADHGFVEAQYRYGICLQNGAASLISAIYYFKLAIAQFIYGIHLRTGDGCPIDVNGGACSLKLGADQDFPFAQFNYSGIRKMPRGVSMQLSLKRILGRYFRTSLHCAQSNRMS